ncbi:type III secretion system chaperone [Prosthecodimorpha staleyi]|uniref:Type III secretion system chaperone n=1 Tax=Prosthecodimorpha staleyi TaxID=2840188 RepID=A0A947D7B1_9HYPH|nr:type III secretion system chaperone [Prosthecodimorpha staleyi]MBT9291429.1 type III secretion system chaperone [Prosthecodimorpha staleyi]
MQLADAVQQLGRQIGLTLKLDSAGGCRLVFDGTLPVDIEAVEGSVAYLHTAIGILPTSGAEALMRSLLEGNLFGRGTGASVIGIDSHLGEILLTRRLDMNKTDYAEFAAAIEDFVTHAKAWIDRLSRKTSGSAEAAPDFGTGETFLRV